MPLIDGDEATRQIKEHLPQMRVIALSMYDEPEKMESMYRAGAESLRAQDRPDRRAACGDPGQSDGGESNSRRSVGAPERGPE